MTDERTYLRYAESLLNWPAEYEKYLENPRYYLFLNRNCYTEEDTDKYIAAIESLSR